jgi:hypothetical protein
VVVTVRCSSNYSIRDPGFTDLMKALAAKGCPALKKLIIAGANVGPKAGAALARALNKGACPALEELRLGRNNMKVRDASSPPG